MERILTNADIFNMLNDQRFAQVVPAMASLHRSAKKATAQLQKSNCSGCQKKRLIRAKGTLVSMFTAAFYAAPDDVRKQVLAYWRGRDSNTTAIVVHHVDKNRRVYTVRVS